MGRLFDRLASCGSCWRAMPGRAPACAWTRCRRGLAGYVGGGQPGPFEQPLRKVCRGRLSIITGARPDRKAPVLAPGW